VNSVTVVDNWNVGAIRSGKNYDDLSSAVVDLILDRDRQTDTL